jgi:hypothetical protein
MPTCRMPARVFAQSRDPSYCFSQGLHGPPFWCASVINPGKLEIARLVPPRYRDCCALGQVFGRLLDAVSASRVAGAPRGGHRERAVSWVAGGASNSAAGPLARHERGGAIVRSQAAMALTRASAPLTAFSATSGPNATPSTGMTSTSVMPMNPRIAFK